MVLIAYNYEGKIISIVNAVNEQVAQAYWQGAGIIPHSTRNLDDPEYFMPLSEHPTGVYPILKTKEVPVSNLQYSRGGINLNAKILTIDK